MANAERFWDRLASTWGKPADPEDPDNETIGMTRPLLGADDRVLDYGCAKGSVALRLARSVGTMRGIDISSKMIAAAQRWQAQRGTGNVTFSHATIFDRTLEPASYDAVLAFNIFHLLQDAEGVMARIHELLAPGGLLISVTPCLAEKGTPINRVLLGIVRLGTRVRLVPPIRFFTIGQLHEALAGAALQVTETHGMGGDVPEYFVVARKAAGGCGARCSA
jgi:2-polyprenyl-3-methyl-5-hydroxy-6-metoxy-1,4-benzoquinol methylase